MEEKDDLQYLYYNNSQLLNQSKLTSRVHVSNVSLMVNHQRESSFSRLPFVSNQNVAFQSQYRINPELSNIINFKKRSSQSMPLHQAIEQPQEPSFLPKIIKDMEEKKQNAGLKYQPKMMKYSDRPKFGRIKFESREVKNPFKSKDNTP